jgi:tRNA A-37 threonylcarbamoyl transferase component Bud32
MKVNDPNEAERFHVGATIAGRYRVERPIGEGAMGAVALARHVSLDERVAIKFLRPELRRDPVAIARLSREAKALARIKSDHVCRVLDVGVTLSVGPYMVMEYLEGTDLGELLDAEGPLPVERAVECVLQVCEALTVAHTAGITHRDLKPQNLFLARHGQFETLKVLDFGIAEDHTEAGSFEASGPASGERGRAPLYGTPSYMSPERVRNDMAADHRSDIWSVGVVLHELVTGRAVFDAPTLTETCARVLADAPLDLELDESVLPASLRVIIARCLERDPNRRYQSVEELAAVLAPLATMQERFRGRSTGAFSRKMVEEALARSQTQRVPLVLGAHAPAAPSEVSAALRTGLSEIATGLRGLARAVPALRIYERPLWLYGAVALASAFSVLLVASISGDVHWINPPPVALQAEPVDVSARDSVQVERAHPPSAAMPSAPLLLETSGVTPDPAMSLGSARAAYEPRRAQGRSSGATEGTGVGGTLSEAEPMARSGERINPPRRHRRLTVDPAAKAKVAAPVVEPALDSRMRLVTERASRVRLVQDKLVTNTSAQELAEDEASEADRVASASKRGAESTPSKLPDWLQAIKPRSTPPDEPDAP